MNLKDNRQDFYHKTIFKNLFQIQNRWFENFRDISFPDVFINHSLFSKSECLQDDQWLTRWSQNTDYIQMFTPIGANGKLLTLNFHIDTGAATSLPNN